MTSRSQSPGAVAYIMQTLCCPMTAPPLLPIRARTHLGVLGKNSRSNNPRCIFPRVGHPAAIFLF